MTNEQLVLRIMAKEDVATNMLQLWKQNKGFIARIAKKVFAVRGNGRFRARRLYCPM